MAEGGFDFEMDDFGKDDPDKDDDYDDQRILDDEETTSFIDRRYSEISQTPEELAKKEKKKQYTVDDFYNMIEEKYKIEPSVISYEKFKIGSDDKLYVKFKNIKDPIQLTKTTGEFIELSTLEKKIGKGGADVIRKELSLPDYRSGMKKLSKEAATKLQNVDKNLQDTENKPLNDLPGAINTVVKSIETTFPVLSTEGTQTIMTKREMDGVMKAMTDIRDELTNNLAKLSSVDKDLEKEKRKLEQAKGDNDEYQVNRISNRIKDLESERSARMEVINNNREQLRSQVNRIRETIHKVLNEDTTLRERIRTLFKEQGITIVSILTALGMTIGVIVEAVIPRGAGVTPTPGPGESVKDWIKKQLTNLGKLLAKLAGKAAEALPGIIGAIVSWLLSTTAGVISWVSENLWALLVLVVGLLFAAAKEYISRSRR